MALGVICGKYPRHSYKKTGSQTKDEEEEKEEENKTVGCHFLVVVIHRHKKLLTVTCNK